MNLKNILHLVAFGLTFSVSVSFALAVKALQGPTAAERINSVLAEDIENGFSRRVSFDDFKIQAVRTNEYVTASENINVENLPVDFQIAWQNHMQAWRVHSNYLNDGKNNCYRDDNYYRMSSGQINEINRTWYEVLRVARQHKAVIPANAYR